MGNDLKIILYIVVAIVWVVYNNYRKIAGEARKRNPSKSPDEVIKENWPTVSGERQDRSAPRPSPVTREPLKREVTPPTKKRMDRPSTQRHAEEIMAASFMVNPIAEGGRIKPSGMVHFEEASMAQGEQIAQIERLRHTDLQAAFLWSEIFKNPYNQSLETIKYN